jgi:phosphatidate cytidylyltransferase
VLKQRIITGIVLVALLLVVIYVLPRPVFTLAVGVAVMLGAWEWTYLSGVRTKNRRIGYLALVAVLFLLMMLVPMHQSIVIVSAISIVWWLFATFTVIQFQRKNQVLPRKPDVLNLIGLLVLLPFWFSVVTLNSGSIAYDATHPVLLFAIILVVLADTSAYFIGRKYGKRKLASLVSPGKTWEGLLGALLTVMIAVLPLAKILGVVALSQLNLLLLAFITVIAALVGDLFESVMKRIADVKDCGNILPGHGGVLDRIDAYTAAMPIFMAAYFVLAG